jgi:TorA maturation chaperone TorD
MPEQINVALDPVASSRANVFYVLARALEPPRTWDEDLPGLLVSSFGAMPEPLPELGAKLYSQVAEILGDREQAAIDHAKLFLGPFEILVAPWASFYLEEEPRLMGPTSHYAARAYADAGLAPGEKLKDAPDHVTHELEFMYFLAFSEATTGDPAWTDRQDLFWQEHLGRWLPKFAVLPNAGRDDYGHLRVRERCAGGSTARREQRCCDTHVRCDAWMTWR